MSEYLVNLSQDSDIILAIRFQYPPVIKDVVLLTFIPFDKLCSFRVVAHIRTKELLGALREMMAK
jgi:hypothetical protein